MRKEKSRLTQSLLAILITLLLFPALTWPQQKDQVRILMLKECLDLALKNNPTISLSRERIQEMIQDYNIARSGLFPTLSLRAYANWVDPGRLSPGGVANTTTLFGQENLGLLSTRLNIFDGLKTYYGMKGAKIGEESQREALRGTKEEVLSQVYQAYYRLLEAKETFGVAEESKKQREGFRDMAEALLKVGKVTKLDFLRSDSQVIDADQTIVQAQNNIILARTILKKTMGLRDEEEIDIPAETPKISSEPLDELALWEKAREKNSDVRKINLDIERAKANISFAKADYWPVISFQAGYGYRNRDVGGTAEEYSYGFFLDYAIFSGGLTRATVGKAKSVSLQLEDSKKALLDQLKVDLNTALSQIRDALKGMDSAKGAIAVNQEAYDSTMAMYQAGKLTSLDIMQAQISLINSKASYVNYYANYQTALAQLRKIIGEGEKVYEK
ncbi:MAG TPA: TolC family protein [Thermodesulfobacteriota bacterium]|nr:TolC family protein [Thermodesulfobacteriota bacterium]